MIKKLFSIALVFSILLFQSFSEDFDKYQEIEFSELHKKWVDAWNKKDYSELANRYFKSRCHFREIEKNETYNWTKTYIKFFGDGRTINFCIELPTPKQQTVFPENTQFFTPFEIYYHYSPIKRLNDDGSVFLDVKNVEKHLDGYKELDVERFIGMKYLACDNLRIRKEPSLNAKKIGILKQYKWAKILEIGKKETIDDIDSVWVKVETENNLTGWCFAGYLTLGSMNYYQ